VITCLLLACGEHKFRLHKLKEKIMNAKNDTVTKTKGPSCTPDVTTNLSLITTGVQLGPFVLVTVSFFAFIIFSFNLCSLNLCSPHAKSKHVITTIREFTIMSISYQSKNNLLNWLLLLSLYCFPITI
jgi:hypothetical protein